MRALSNRSLVGITLPFFGGTSRVIDAHIKFEYERARWSMDWLSNKAVSRVYGSVYPDLGDQLTAVVFLVDERVFNRELYPDFQEEKLPYGVRKPSKKVETELEERNEANYQKWLEKVGGPTNAFLRE